MGQVKTDFLTATSGFLTGVGSSMGIGGSFYGFNYSRSPEEADFLAMKADWIMVGQDLSGAIKKAEAHPECLTLEK